MVSQLSTDAAEQAILVRATASAVGLGEGPFRFLRFGINNVYINDDDLTVARVAPPHETFDIASDRLHNIELLVDAGAPLLSPLTSVLELADGRFVTYWPLADADRTISVSDMAELIAQWHGVSAPLSLEMWTPGYDDARREQMIAAGVEAVADTGPAGRIAASALDFLLTELEDARASLVELWDELPHTHPVVPVHGDLYPGNVVFHDGRYLLIDCDFLCAGPPEADLTQIVSHYEREIGDLSGRILAEYGLRFDEEFLRCATRVRELNHGLWLVSMWDMRPESREELRIRVENWFGSLEVSLTRPSGSLPDPPSGTPANLFSLLLRW